MPLPHAIASREIGRVEREQLEAVDADAPRRAHDVLAGARALVEAAAADLDRGVHRRDLVVLADARGHGGEHRVAGDVLPRLLVDDDAAAIERVGRRAEARVGDVGLVLAEQERRELGRGADRHRQHAGRDRIERAAVADAVDADTRADVLDGDGRRHAGGLVDDEDAVARHRYGTLSIQVSRIVEPSGSIVSAPEAGMCLEMFVVS